MSTRGRLHISGELPLNVHVVYGITAKQTCCMITRLKYAISTACDIMFNLKVGQKVQSVCGFYVCVGMV